MLSENDKKEGLLKKLKNIEDQGKKQWDPESLKVIDYFSQLSAKELYVKIKKEKNDIDPEKFV